MTEIPTVAEVRTEDPGTKDDRPPAKIASLHGSGASGLVRAR